MANEEILSDKNLKFRVSQLSEEEQKAYQQAKRTAILDAHRQGKSGIGLNRKWEIFNDVESGQIEHSKPPVKIDTTDNTIKDFHRKGERGLSARPDIYDLD